MSKRAVSLIVPSLACVAAFGADVPVRTLEVLSPLYTVDREYRSMTGPSSVRVARIVPPTPLTTWPGVSASLPVVPRSIA